MSRSNKLIEPKEGVVAGTSQACSLSVRRTGDNLGLLMPSKMIGAGDRGSLVGLSPANLWDLMLSPGSGMVSELIEL